MPNHPPTQVAILGAGPYGLSLAAHLNEANIPCRIFGHPMQTWREQMPRGMELKSDGFASDLSAGHRPYTLGQYCQEHGIPYSDTHIPVALDTFVAYGLEFQKRFVPQLEPNNVTRVERTSSGFRLTLDDGREVTAPHVVVAAGISHFPYLPPMLAGLPRDLVTHTSEHHDLSRFAGRDVTILGAGASASETAAILREHGAHPTIVARSRTIVFFETPPPGPRSLVRRLRAPATPLGEGWRNLAVVKAPHLFYRLPLKVRHHLIRTRNGPASNWPVKERVVGKVPMLTGMSLQSASIRDGRVHLALTGKDGPVDHVAGHVIAATGYRVNLTRLTFLSSLFDQIEVARGAPVLDPGFQSSVPGLYFVGVSSAACFGPLMRFACGSRYASFRLTRRLQKAIQRHAALTSVPATLPPAVPPPLPDEQSVAF